MAREAPSANETVFTAAPVRGLVSVDTRSIGKLEGAITAFRLVVTVAAGLLSLAIITGVQAETATGSAALLLLLAIAGPLLHGYLASILREDRENALVITLATTAVLFLFDGIATITVHVENALQSAWPYVTLFVLAAITHVAVLIMAGQALAKERAEEITEPEDEPETEAA